MADETTTFLADEEVTAQNLNDIAVDLGYGDFTMFTNDTPYAVGKLNEITSSLVTKGITQSLGQFEVTVSDDKIIVSSGVGIFESGRKIKLTAQTSLDFATGEVFLEENPTTGTITLKVGEFSDNDYIWLATVGSGGTVTDRRQHSASRVDFPTVSKSYFKECNVVWEYDSGFYYAVIGEFAVSENSLVFVENGESLALGHYDCKTGKSYGSKVSSSSLVGNKGETDINYGTKTHSTWLYFEMISEETLRIRTRSDSPGSYNSTYSYTVYVFNS